MLSTGEAIRRKGTDTLNQYFLPDRDLTYEEVVYLFRGLAMNEHTTRFTINASDPRVFPEDGSKPLRTLTSDPVIISRGAYGSVYEDIDEWVDEVKDIDVYEIAGSFDFDGKWTYIEIQKDGTICALFRKDRGDLQQILSDAEAMAMAMSS